MCQEVASLLFYCNNMDLALFRDWSLKITKIRISNIYLKCAKPHWFKTFKEVQDCKCSKSADEQRSIKLLCAKFYRFLCDSRMESQFGRLLRAFPCSCFSRGCQAWLQATQPRCSWRELLVLRLCPTAADHAFPQVAVMAISLLPSLLGLPGWEEEEEGPGQFPS